jgi:hypothetical protein
MMSPNRHSIDTCPARPTTHSLARFFAGCSSKPFIPARFPLWPSIAPPPSPPPPAPPLTAACPRLTLLLLSILFCSSPTLFLTTLLPSPCLSSSKHIDTTYAGMEAVKCLKDAGSGNYFNGAAPSAPASQPPAPGTPSCAPLPASQRGSMPRRSMTRGRHCTSCSPLPPRLTVLPLLLLS